MYFVLEDSETLRSLGAFAKVVTLADGFGAVSVDLHIYPSHSSLVVCSISIDKFEFIDE
jgi:hypothetical protein